MSQEVFSEQEGQGESIAVPAEYEVTAEILETAPINNVQRHPKPWHRPRKQYVRRQQWATSLSRLIADAGLTGEVSYLGLPGDEFLDVRYLASGPIATAGLKLKFLGFNDSDEAVAEAAESTEDASADIPRLSALEETRNHMSIVGDSDVQPDDFRRLAKVGSPAYLAVDKLGPFDIVNLDLTQSIFAKSYHGDTYTSAIRQLLGIQTRASHDWLLWVTTRVDKQAVHNAQAVMLLKIVQDRFTDCPALLTLWAPLFDAPSPAQIDLESCSDRDYAGVIFIGMCLWLYGLGEQPVRQMMSVKSSFRYRVRTDAETSDMFSLVVRVSPRVALPLDATGLTPEKIVSQPLDRCADLQQIVQRYEASVDIEARIAADLSLREELVEETAKLLELLKIDRSFFLAWVKDYSA
jgi:hypothetical protein